MKNYASQEDIEVIKSMSREKLEEYAIMMCDIYYEHKNTIKANLESIQWYIDYINNEKRESNE